MPDVAPFLPGLVSVTFRKLSTGDVIDLVAKAKLTGIEWGGDVHVPAGAVATAKSVGQATRDAGLAVAAYGSYYRLSESPADEFSRVVDSAVALETKIIRVWAGQTGSAVTDSAGRERVVDDGRRISHLAAAAGLTIACEWHANTLTDTSSSADALFRGVDHPAFQTYWQPNQRMTPDRCLIDMNTALPRLVGLHVFEWSLDTVEKRPLAEGEAHWRRYFEKVRQANKPPMFALLEFVRNEDPAQFLQDAETLNRWLA